MNATQLSQLCEALQSILAPVQQAVVAVQQYQHQSGQQGQLQWTPAIPQGNKSGLAMLTHLSGLTSWIIGPATIYGSPRRGSVIRREAAKAFSYQLTSSIIFIVGSILFGIIGAGPLIGLMWLGWFGPTIGTGVKAAPGEDWTNPVNKWIKLNPLPTDGR